jgi:hypothetical protein
MADEDLVHPLVRGAVLGEQDHTTVVPLAVRLQVGREQRKKNKLDKRKKEKENKKRK